MATEKLITDKHLFSVLQHKLFYGLTNEYKTPNNELLYNSLPDSRLIGIHRETYNSFYFHNKFYEDKPFLLNDYSRRLNLRKEILQPLAPHMQAMPLRKIITDYLGLFSQKKLKELTKLKLKI